MLSRAYAGGYPVSGSGYSTSRTLAMISPTFPERAVGPGERVWWTMGLGSSEAFRREWLRGRVTTDPCHRSWSCSGLPSVVWALHVSPC